jgi:K+/H+ antiporter YhaU regulatory subunit KhtT
MRALFGVSVIGHKRAAGGDFDMPPSGTPIEAGDTLIVVGRGPDCGRLAAAAVAA